jgi:sec-independent protein translocase protein TatB
MAGAGLTGFLQNLSGGEMIVILIVALVVLGPERLPEMARGAGRMVHKLKTMTEGLQSEVRDVMEDPSMQPLRELGELAARPRQKLTEYALEAEAEQRSRKEAAAHAEHRAAVEEADAAEAQQAEAVEATENAEEPTDAPASRLGPLVAAVEQQAARAKASDPTATVEGEQGGAEDHARP